MNPSGALLRLFSKGAPDFVPEEIPMNKKFWLPVLLLCTALLGACAPADLSTPPSAFSAGAVTPGVSESSGFPAETFGSETLFPPPTARPDPQTVCPSSAMEPEFSATVRLTFAGDCSFGAINAFDGPRYFPTVYRDSGSVSYPFDGVKSIFENDDLTVVNFEGTLTDATDEADKQWHFKGDGAFARILPAASVEVALLTNNHCGDYLEQGYADTVRHLSAEGVGLVEENEPFVTTVNGVSVVIIGDSSVVGEDTTHTDGVAERVLAQIARWKNGRTIVVVDMHWGSEYTEAPSEWQRATARAFIDAGADLVVGQHPHIVQGIERYRGKPIVYSLGNFAFGGNCLARYPETFLFQIVFAVDGDGVSVASTEIIPCFVSSGTERNDAGVLWNNFSPRMVSGAEAEQVLTLIEARSALLK